MNENQATANNNITEAQQQEIRQLGVLEYIFRNGGSATLSQLDKMFCTYPTKKNPR